MNWDYLKKSFFLKDFTFKEWGKDFEWSAYYLKLTCAFWPKEFVTVMDDISIEAPNWPPAPLEKGCLVMLTIRL